MYVGFVGCNSRGGILKIAAGPWHAIRKSSLAASGVISQPPSVTTPSILVFCPIKNA